MALFQDRVIALAVATVLLHMFVTQGFEIPLPFGSIAVSKGENNETNIDLNRNINILGYGTNSGLSIGAKNGSITTKTSGGVLVNNTNYGANSTFGVDKSKGLAVDTDLNLGDKTVQGGLGKENNFLQGLVDLFKPKPKRRF